MIDWFRLQILKARMLIWMLIVQRKFALGESGIWRNAPLDVVAIFSSMSEEVPPGESADDETSSAWRLFVRSAKLEKTRRLRRLQQNITNELGE